MLTVKNGNDFQFTGRYNGIDYVFPLGAVVALTEDAARHIFGIGMENKQDILVRHGWMKTSADLDTAMKNLNGFSFDVAENISPGDIVAPDSAEQGTAPLQVAGGDMTTDGVVPPTQPSVNRGSIFSQLGG